MKKVLVNVTIALTIETQEENLNISDVIQEMDYKFTTAGTSMEAQAHIKNSEIRDFEVLKAEKI